MTQQEWEASTDAVAMLAWVTGKRPVSGYPANLLRSEISPRRLRLFACAYCRFVWHLLTDPRSRRAVEALEDAADGMETVEHSAAIVRGRDVSVDYMHRYSGPSGGLHPERAQWNAADAVGAICDALGPFPERVNDFFESLSRAELFATGNEPSGKLGAPAWGTPLLRSMVNPFRWHPARCELCHEDKSVEIKGQFYRDRQPLCFSCRNPGIFTWNGALILKLATAAYAERLEEQCGACKGGKWEATRNPNWRTPCETCRGSGRICNGQIDPDRLAILADALEDSDCTDEALLMPLRGKRLCPGCNGKGKRDCMVDAGYNNPLMKQHGWQWCCVCNDCGRGPTPGWIADPSPRFRGMKELDVLLGKE